MTSNQSAGISTEFEIEWPPKSGKKIMIPEVDRGEWFTVTDAKEKNKSCAGGVD